MREVTWLQPDMSEVASDASSLHFFFLFTFSRERLSEGFFIKKEV